jgi:hypothetical protein
MSRRFVLVLALALVLVPAARAVAPSFIALQGGEGLASADGTIHYVAQNAPEATTTLQIVRRSGVVASRTIDGAFGVPELAGVHAEGLFRDGSAFVVQNIGFKSRTEFRIVDTTDLSVRDSVSLDGTFSYDALSPNGKVLYLVQYTSENDISHYVVRAYDLASHTLRPGRIADKAQRGWVMQGFAVTRTSSKNGRWVYTMYANPGGGYPFVHALDTVAGTAHCVGFASPGDDNVFNGKLVLRAGKLQVRTESGALWRVIDVRTWRVTNR